MDPKSLPETTEILYGEDAARSVAEFIAGTKQTLDVIADSAAPSVTVNVESYKRLLLSLKQRGTRVRYIVEITPDNLGYCKQMTEFVELRHLNDIKGNFGVADGNDYFASAVLEQSKPIVQLIHSNAKQIVQQHQYLFSTLWALAMPAEQKIQEIEDGKASSLPNTNTKIIDSQEDIISRARHVIETSNHLFVCSTLDGLKMIESIASDSIKEILEKSQKGQHKGVRWIGTISKEHIDVVQRFLASGMEIKHLRYTPMNFSVTDKEFNFTVSNMIGGSIAASVLISNEQPYIKQFNSLFEQLWSQGIDAADKIRELEEGIPADRIEVIRNPEEIKRIYFDLIKSAKNEVMLILPTATAFKREEKTGIIESLMEAAARGVKVRILTPTEYETDEVMQKTQSLKESHSIHVRTIKRSAETVEIKIVVVDRKTSLIIEIKDDSKQTFTEAVGSAVYGTGKPRVMSYVTIFDSFWNQSELYEHVREANKKLERLNEQLQIHDKMQTEFVNIAAHELRTPVQPILAMVDMLKDSLDGKKEVVITEEEVAILERNSKRLQKLSSEILDATRIESGTLRLEQSLVDLNVKVRNVIEDSKSLIRQGQKIVIQFKPSTNVLRNNAIAPSLPVMVDKLRMFEVISNLIRNAIKYSDVSEGERTITVSTEKQGNEAIVSVKDQGVGINPDLMPRLFTKFSTDRVLGGTGLGLYISKAILEAHGGRIWAENNKDGNGATFYFALPLAKEGFDP